MAASKNIRAIKTKQNELRHHGMPSMKAGKVAATQVTGKSSKSKDPKKKGSDASDSKDKRLPPAKVYAGGKRTGKFQPPSKLSAQEKNKIKRGGKGTRSFKSKAKHKRR